MNIMLNVLNESVTDLGIEIVDVRIKRTDLPEEIKEKIYNILADYITTDEGLAIMDEIYGWTDLVPAINSEFDVVREAAQEFGLYDD